MRKNVLISTTRQWNPGDEFIMQGALNVLNHLDKFAYNPIIYNRNPEIRGGARFRNQTRNYSFTYKWDKANFKGKGIISEIFRIGNYDNSWKDDMRAENIDLALFAGSPEWYGNRLKNMYKVIKEADIPTIFLGLGAGSSEIFDPSESVVREVLSKALIITTRDKYTEKLLKEFDAIYVPCPAFLAAKSNRKVERVTKIGLIYATNETLKGNNVSKRMHDYLIPLYLQLAKEFRVGIVCHYVDEIDKAIQELPGIDIYYSYDSKDYVDIYNQFDLVVGGRVHGIGISASLGIPGIMIKHDERSSTTDGFLAKSIQVGTDYQEVKALIQDMSAYIGRYSENLLEHKENVMQMYVNLLRDKL